MNSISNIHKWTGSFLGLWRKGDAEIWSSEGKVVEIIHQRRMNAIIRSPKYIWSIEFGGIFTKEFCIFDQETGEEVAIVERKLLRNFELIFRDKPGKKLSLRKRRWADIWNNTFVWEDELASVYMTFRLPFNPFSRQMDIMIDFDKVDEKDAVFLSGLGLYLMRFVRNRK